MKKCLAFLVLSQSVFWVSLGVAAEPVDDEKSIEELIATQKLQRFLDSIADVPSDYSCWVETYCSKTDLKEDSVRLGDKNFIYAANEKERWQLWAEGRPLPDGSLPSPFWTQYLRVVGSPLQRTLGVEGSGRSGFYKSEQQTPHFKPSCPAYWCIVNGGAVIAGNANEAYVVDLYLEGSKFVSGRYETGTGDFMAVWQSPGSDYQVQQKVRFGKKSRFMPTHVSYIHISEKEQHPFYVIDTQWEAQAGGYLPSVIHYASTTPRQDSVTEAECRLSWLVGSVNPDEVPAAAENDWRQVFCRLFQRECYDFSTSAMARSKTYKMLRELRMKQSTETPPNE